SGWRQFLESALKVMDRQGQLLEVVLALRAASGLACLLNGGQEQGDEDRDNSDHDQQFDEGEPSTCSRRMAPEDAPIHDKDSQKRETKKDSGALSAPLRKLKQGICEGKIGSFGNHATNMRGRTFF